MAPKSGSARHQAQQQQQQQEVAPVVRLTSPQSSMVYSFLLFVIILSAQQVYGELLASKEWLTIVGGFISSILFLLCLTFIGNFQEANNMRAGWGAVFISLFLATVAAASVHRVSATTCILFSLGLLYEVNAVSAVAFPQSDAKKKGL